MAQLPILVTFSFTAEQVGVLIGFLIDLLGLDSLRPSRTAAKDRERDIGERERDREDNIRQRVKTVRHRGSLVERSQHADRDTVRPTQRETDRQRNAERENDIQRHDTTEKERERER
ncbi:MAG: hypothetical protein P4L61_01915, partial [Candidatus Pacebacteria bacterium]|nr:hypothetical protein [Candidatus Paceibacterota bacterium]